MTGLNTPAALTELLNTWGLTFLFIVCRFGATLALLPGFASARVPVNVRVGLLLSLSIAVTPMLATQINAAKVLAGGLDIAQAIFQECAIGLVFGFWCQLFLHAARFAGTFMAMCIGLSGIPGQPIDSNEAESNLAVFLSLGVTATIFATDVHLLSLRTLVDSYRVMPFGAALEGPHLLEETTSLLGDTFLLSLQISGPIAVLCIIGNFALGLVGKFTPQLQIFFAATGAITLGGLLMIALLAPAMLNMPVVAYQSWLERAAQ